MSEFAKYYVEFLRQFFSNIVDFLSDIFVKGIGGIFTDDIPGYFNSLKESIGGFGVGGWICFILVWIINLALIVFLVYRLVLAVRKFIFVRHKSVEKEELYEELAKMKEQSEKLAIEKNKIFNLKFNELAALDMNKSGVAAEGEEKKAVALASRFSKLIDIDEKYRSSPAIIKMEEDDMLPLDEVVNRFIAFAASQLNLYYKHDVVRRFIAGMATSKVIILEGISGTGKTSLPYAMGRFLDNSSTIVSVQPSWRDRTELLGYLNEFTKKFNETDFLASVYEASFRDDINFIVLDEMNLARIEYYFAEFLSVMEMPDTSEWKIDLVPAPQESDPRNVVNGKIVVPQNLWFIGTANQDDSTFTVTDKVYDRAVAIDIDRKGEYFNAPITEKMHISYDYLESLFDEAAQKHQISEGSLDALSRTDDFITNKFRITFGNRILKQIKLFVPVYIACGGTEIEALDFIFMSKILRKFKSLNLVFLTKELAELKLELDRQFGKNSFKISKDYISLLEKNI